MKSSKDNELEGLLFANVVSLTPEDYELNKNGVNLRCTHENYIIGKIINDEGERYFIDELSIIPKVYRLFDNISSAEKYYEFNSNNKFVINAHEIKSVIGSQKFENTNQLKKILRETGLEFTFMNEIKESMPNIKTLNKQKVRN